MKLILFYLVFIALIENKIILAQLPDLSNNFKESITFQEEYIYSVHLISSDKPIIDVNFFDNILHKFPQYDLIVEQGKDGWYRYYLGYFLSAEEVFNVANIIKQMGFSSCYVQRIDKKTIKR